MVLSLVQEFLLSSPTRPQSDVSKVPTGTRLSSAIADGREPVVHERSSRGETETADTPRSSQEAGRPSRVLRVPLTHKAQGSGDRGFPLPRLSSGTSRRQLAAARGQPEQAQGSFVVDEGKTPASLVEAAGVGSGEVRSPRAGPQVQTWLSLTGRCQVQSSGKKSGPPRLPAESRPAARGQLSSCRASAGRAAPGLLVGVEGWISGLGDCVPSLGRTLALVCKFRFCASR